MQNRQQQIEAFLAAAHALAVQRLRADPGLVAKPAALLARWRQAQGATRADRYRDEWEALLAAGVEAVADRVLAQDDHAAALRSVSPLSVLITQAERAHLLRQARASS